MIIFNTRPSFSAVPQHCTKKIENLSNILQKGKQKCLISTKYAQTTRNTSTFLQWVNPIFFVHQRGNQLPLRKETVGNQKKLRGWRNKTLLSISLTISTLLSLASSPLLSRIKQAVLSRVFSLCSSPTQRHGQHGNCVKKKKENVVTSGSERSCKILVVTISFSQNCENA